jgi:cell division inhibitor SulA/protein ImuA
VNDSLQKLLQSSKLWKARAKPGTTEQQGLASGYPKLDHALPGGGWPRNALTEILLADYGIGELQLLMPALARLSNGAGTNTPGWIAWIAPPFQPYPPALSQWGMDISRVLMMQSKENAEILWAADQALSSGVFSAVLLWPVSLHSRDCRRLQLAAEKGHSWGIVFRQLSGLKKNSAAALRIQLMPGSTGTDIGILKSRGGRPVVVRDYAS